jgi:integrase/recombinase XerD
MKVTLLLRCRLAEGASRKMLKPVYAANGKLKPLFALVNGKPEHHPEGVYQLRYQVNGRRVFETLGSDPAEALTALKRRELLLQSEELGLEVLGKPFALRRAAREAQPKKKRLIAELGEEYIREIARKRVHRTTKGYERDLNLFKASCPKRYLEDVDRADVLTFLQRLRERGNGPRTAFNRVAWLRTFFRHFEQPFPLASKDFPKYTKKVVAAYQREELRTLFAAATDGQRLLYQFFLGSGAREQEVMHACWEDIDFVSGVWSIRAKPEWRWQLKDNEERAVPLPDTLLADLKARRLVYQDARLIFPGRLGKPEGHFLRTLKKLAHKAGLNCGACRSKKGLSCADYPVCKKWELHKFRKTFATLHSESGVSVRTLMGWLGHSDLETTLTYLSVADIRSTKTRSQVNNTFSGL